MNKALSIGAGHDPAGMLVKQGHPFKGGLFAAAIFAASLVFQRFAIPAGETGIDVVGPIGLFLAGLALMRGDFVLDRRRLMLFVWLLVWIITGSILRALNPTSFNVSFSVNSLGQFVLLTAFCVLSFSQPVDENAFFRRATQFLAVIAAAGIVQFVAQFAGIHVFSFKGFLPEKWLFESGYNLVIPTGIGALDKSNGFFLLEPSIFSQIMAIALIIEILAFRRLLYLLLFSFALLLAFSGTGLIILASFLLSASVRLGSRGILLSISGAAILMIVAVFAIYFVPDAANVFLHRINEVNEPGTSGYGRFHTPLQALGAAWHRENGAWLFGIGAGASRQLNLPLSFNLDTPIKIMLEYGIPAIVLYTLMILRAQRTRLQSLLVLPSIVLLFVAGGYEQFAPVLFPIFLLLCVARLRPTFANSAL